MFDSLKRKISKRSSNPPAQRAHEANKSSTHGGFLAPNSGLTNPSQPTRRPRSSSNSPLPSEPPPAYTPAPPASASGLSTNPALTQARSDNNPYASLINYNTILIIDDSGSMAGSRWAEVERALSAIAPIIASHDEDGIDIYFLNNKKVWLNQTTAGDIIEIFQDARPGGMTFTAKRLYDVLNPYLAQYKRDPGGTKPVNIIVITDGEAHDDVAGMIQSVAKKLDKWDAPPWQVGIQFFQVGNDPSAREMLKQLDDELAGKDDLRDIVDTVPFTSESGGELTAAGIMKVVLGSVNRRLDRNSKELHRS